MRSNALGQANAQGRHRALAEDPPPARLGRRQLAAAIRRHRLDPSSSTSSRRRAPLPARPRRLPFGAEDGRAGDHALRQRGAAEAFPAAHPFRRGLVVPGLFGAGLRLRPRIAQDARRAQGRQYLVNGQKTWTTLGQHADWIFCLVRTDPKAKPQAGISFLLIDMKSPASRCARSSLMDGEHEVNEVWFDNVEVPVGEPRRRGKQRLDLRQVPARPRAHQHRRRRLLQARARRLKRIAAAERERPAAARGYPAFAAQWHRGRDRADGAGDHQPPRHLRRGRAARSGARGVAAEDQGHRDSSRPSRS